MRILHLSDTHGLHRQLGNLPSADVIVHSGDFTLRGTPEEATDFTDWFSNLPYRYKLFVAGNHDDCYYTESHRDSEPRRIAEGCYYLSGTGIEIDGVRFYGVSMLVQEDINGRYKLLLENIPANIDVLITHQPPYGVLDECDAQHYGSPTLLETILQVKPQVHLFGHTHNAYGTCVENGTFYSNASVVDENYKLCHQPRLIIK